MTGPTTKREVEVRGWDPSKNLEDLVSLICSDMRCDGLPLLRLKVLKKTHGKRTSRQTIARLMLKRVAGCLHVLGRYHRRSSYQESAANHKHLVCQPVPGSSKYEGSWDLRDTGPNTANR